jgi:hypothetical protein
LNLWLEGLPHRIIILMSGQGAGNGEKSLSIWARRGIDALAAAPSAAALLNANVGRPDAASCGS